MKAAELFVKALEPRASSTFSACPERKTRFLDALHDHPKIRTILVRHEQAAGFMAATYARLTGRILVAYSTLGAGATNLATAAHAHLGNFPVLFVTGQKPVRENRQGLYQLLEVASLMAPTTKCARTIESGAQIAHVVHDAFRTMREGRPGPELPEDVAGDETDGNVSIAGHGAAPVADAAALQAADDALRNARSPLVMLGPAAERHGIPEATRAFLDKTGIPFFCTWMGKGVAMSAPSVSLEP